MNTKCLMLPLLFVSMLHCPLLFSQSQTKLSYDLVIHGARVIDGTGNPWFHADVGVSGDRIAKIDQIAGSGTKEIDARGLVLSPGFIDMHSHSDYALLVDGNAEGKIRQGVTTEVIGEASSAAPRCPRAKEEDEEATAPYGLSLDWTDFTGYFKRLLSQGIAVNVASYVGQGRARLCGLGPDARAATPEDLTRMRQIVDEAMQQGTIGLSSGLIYAPGSFAPTSEIIELAKVAARYQGIYTSHIRNEGDGIARAIDEALEIGREAKIPVHILHLKVSGKNNWGRMPQVIAHIQKARDEGAEISADQYPYVASATGLSSRLPEWTLDGGIAKLLERLREPATRSTIIQEMRSNPYDWKLAVIALVLKPENKQFEGKSIAELAQARHSDAENAALDLLLQENGTVRMIYFSMNEDDVRYALRVPWVSIGSDGTALKPEGVLGQGRPHPRNYGTFARILSTYVRDEKVLTLEDAIRKMTSLAARQLGILDRGEIREGAFADLLLFDPAKIKDSSTFNDPHRLAEGMSYVIVNGKTVIEHGEHTGHKPGQIIYGRGYLRAAK